MPSFDSATVKLRRAKHHLEALKTEVQALEKASLAQLVREYDPDTRRNLWRWQWVSEDISTKFSPIIGDILTNSRACLDHIIYAFLGGTSVPEKEINWPVSIKQNGWSSAKGRFRGNLPNKALRIVEEYQPSERPDSDDARRVAWLDRLVNIDKHRRLLAVSVDGIGAGMSREYVHEVICNFDDAVKPGAVFASLDGDEVDMEIHPSLSIGFDEAGWLRRRPILYIISSIVSTVQKILERFESQFPQPMR